MSADNEADVMQRCASCGIAGGDDIKLMKCTACYLVKYCGVKCQKDHRKQHKKECKKRAAELKDEILFKQPESSCFGDCPICCLPLPLDPRKSTLTSCCSKRICTGCNVANQKREIEARLENKCAFCRTLLPKTKEDFNKKWMKRIEANDPVAMREIGLERYHEGDHKTAFEYGTRAAALGDAEAHFQLSMMYYEGHGVEKNEKMALHHTEKAAIGGSPHARHNLGCTERENGRMDKAAKHYMIAAKLGHEKSLECVKNMCKDGLVSKEDFAAALRGHQAAIVATKSPQREEAYAFYKSIGK